MNLMERQGHNQNMSINEDLSWPQEAKSQHEGVGGSCYKNLSKIDDDPGFNQRSKTNVLINKK